MAWNIITPIWQSITKVKLNLRLFKMSRQQPLYIINLKHIVRATWLQISKAGNKLFCEIFRLNKVLVFISSPHHRSLVNWYFRSVVEHKLLMMRTKLHSRFCGDNGSANVETMTIWRVYISFETGHSCTDSISGSRPIVYKAAYNEEYFTLLNHGPQSTSSLLRARQRQLELR